MYNTGESRGTSQSYNMNYQKLGHELLHCFVMNSDAHYKTMNRDTTSEFTACGENIAGFRTAGLIGFI